MGDWIPTETLRLLNQLLPGFITAAIVYNFTPRGKGSAFERVVEALIYTLFVQIATAPTKWLLLWIGRAWFIGLWTETSGLAVSVIWAILLGGCLARWFNQQEYPAALARLLASSRTPMPSEWYSALKYNNGWVVLHLHDGRRIYGWAIAWPDRPDEGFFEMTGVEWLGPGNERVPADRTASLLVSVKDVRMVEFVRDAGHVSGLECDVSKEDSNGHRETEANASPGGTGSRVGEARNGQTSASGHTETPAPAGPATSAEAIGTRQEVKVIG